MKKALLLLFLLSASYASLIWQFSSDGPIGAKPLVFQNAIAVASDDGKLYGLDPVTGTKRWEAAVGASPNQPFLYDNGIIVSATQGLVSKVGAGGRVLWSTDLTTSQPDNATYVYGASANGKYIFVTTDSGVFTLEKNGSVRSRIMYFNDSVLTAPAAGADFVVFGSGNSLYRLGESGQTQWKATLPEGSFWISRPVIAGNVVIIGALDDRMHAYIVTNGLELWSVKTRNWVAGTPLVSQGVAYFGSNDGAVYAVESGDGRLDWKAQTQLAVQAEPEAGYMGGQEVIFAGGSDRSIYAISRQSGDIVWKGSAGGAAGSPLFYQNKVVFGSDDGKVYAYSTERACSITSPTEAQLVGGKEVVVSGKHVSEQGGARVMVQINTGSWEDAQTGERDWVFYINPRAKLVPGLNTISCQVADMGGTEAGEVFTTVAITHDPGMPPSDLVVTVSPSIVEGNEFTIYVNDGDDGSPVDRFSLDVDGRKYEGSKNITLTIPAAGTYPATVKKIGFNDAAVNVVVNTSGVNPAYLGGAVVVILLLLFLAWSRIRKAKAPKRR